MASDDYGQLTTILQRLGELGSLLNPLTLVSTVTELIREIATPPPGDPAQLENLAAAFRTAAGVIEPLGDEVRTLGCNAATPTCTKGSTTLITTPPISRGYRSRTRLRWTIWCAQSVN